MCEGERERGDVMMIMLCECLSESLAEQSSVSSLTRTRDNDRRVIAKHFICHTGSWNVDDGETGHHGGELTLFILFFMSLSIMSLLPKVLSISGTGKQRLTGKICASPISSVCPEHPPYRP